MAEDVVILVSETVKKEVLKQVHYSDFRQLEQ